MEKMVTKFERNKSKKVYFCFLFFVFVSLFLFVNVSGKTTETIDFNDGGYVGYEQGYGYYSHFESSNVGDIEVDYYPDYNDEKRGYIYKQSSSFPNIDNKEQIEEIDFTFTADYHNNDGAEINMGISGLNTEQYDFDDESESTYEDIWKNIDDNEYSSVSEDSLGDSSKTRTNTISLLSGKEFFRDYMKNENEVGVGFFDKDTNDNILIDEFSDISMEITYYNDYEPNTNILSGTGDNEPLEQDLSVDVTGDVPYDYYDIRYYRGFDGELLCEKTDIPVGGETSCEYDPETEGGFAESFMYNWYYEIIYDGETYTSSNTTFTTGELNISTNDPEDVNFNDFIMKGELSDIYDDTTANLSFEYRKSGSSSWNSTDVVEESSTPGTSYDYNLTGLEDGELYEYRAVAEDEYQTKEGETYEVLTNSTDPEIDNIDSSVNYSRVELTGNLSDMGIYDDVYTSFEYREDGDDSWENTKPKSRENTEEFSENIELDYNKDYEWRTCVEFSGNKKCDSIESFSTEKPIQVDINNYLLGSDELEYYFDKLEFTANVTEIDPELEYFDFEFLAALSSEEVDGDDFYKWNDMDTYTKTDKYRVSPDDLENGYYEIDVKIDDLDTAGFSPESGEDDEYYEWMIGITGFTEDNEYDKEYFEEYNRWTKYGNRIEKVEDLFSMRTQLNDTYYLANNIDFCSDEDYREPDSGFVSIDNFCEKRGSDEGYLPVEDTFNGELDGTGNYIENLYINRENSSNVGLFSKIGGEADIKNIGMINNDIKGKDNVGTITGYLTGNSTLDQVYVYGENEGRNNVSNFIGKAYNHTGLVSNFYLFGNVECNDFCGMISGYSNGIIGEGVSDYQKGYIVGNVYAEEYEYDGIGSGYGGEDTYFEDIIYNAEQTTLRPIGETNLNVIYDDFDDRSTSDMKRVTTYEDYGFDITDVDEKDETDENYIWNIVDYETYPFFSNQGEYIEFEELGKPNIKKDIPDFDLSYNENFTVDLDDHFERVDEYRFFINGEWYEGTDRGYEDAYIKINLIDRGLDIETEDKDNLYNVKVKAINPSGSVEEEFELGIKEVPEKDYFEGDITTDKNILEKVVDGFLSVFPDERGLTDYQKIGFVFIILMFISILVLAIGGLNPVSIIVTIIFDIMVFILLSFLGYVPSSLFIWVVLSLVVFSGYKLYKRGGAE